MNPNIVPARTPDPSDESRRLAKLIAEELAFSLKTGGPLKTREVNQPVTQRVIVVEEVAIKDFKTLQNLIVDLSDAVETSSPNLVTVEDTLKKVLEQVSRDYPAFPTELKAEMTNAKDITNAIAELGEKFSSIDVKAGDVTVAAPAVTVEAPDLTELAKSHAETVKSLKEAVKAIKAIDLVIPSPDYKEIIDALATVRLAVDSIPVTAPAQFPTDGKGNLSVTTQNSLVKKPYDSIVATYPAATSEAYTYKLGQTVQNIVTVVYSDATKAVLTSVTVS